MSLHSTRILRILGVATSAAAIARPAHAQTNGTSAYDALAPELVVSAIIRDFKPAEVSGGHPDFQAFSGPAARIGLVENTLNAEGKPSLKSTSGTLIATEWKDEAGRAILPALFDAGVGDTPGAFAASTPANVTSEASFASWFVDTPGVNTSRVVELTLNRKPGTNRYVIDSAQDEPWKSRGGFFPINKQLYGNYGSTGKNYHFTTEIEMTFTFDAGVENIFMFTGDDDLWVFIDGRLVMDLGGLHPRREQFLDVGRLGWLEHGRSYVLKIFHAERRTNESNFRVETTLALKTVQPPSTSAMYD